MGLKLSSPIATARTILNDNSSGKYRYSPEDLLSYANDCLDELIELAPHLFYTDGEVECTAGQCLQQLPYDNAKSLVDIIGIKNGPAITQGDRAVLDRFRPSWPQDAAGQAQNWMPIVNDPMRFFVYPKAPSAQVLKVIYVKIPDEYAADADTGLPPSIGPAVADYIVARAEGRDDEHINTNRATQYLASFAARFQKKV